MNKTLRAFTAALAAALCTAGAAGAMTIGTFNIEYFSVYGDRRYVPSDLEALASSIRKSGADVLALQEIEGAATMRFFVTHWLRGWNYAGNDTDSTQDLFFLWNENKVSMEGSPKVFYANQSCAFEGRKFRLFDRPPLSARFRDKKNGRIYTLTAVHLKSNFTGNSRDKEAARRYNEAKRRAQIEKLNQLAENAEGPTFILGDYNDPNPQREVNYPLLGLERGTSFDSWGSNLDYIGFVNISRTALGPVKETETRIRRRSTKKKEHPDHDIITVEILE